jgi:hypothetical protein
MDVARPILRRALLGLVLSASLSSTLVAECRADSDEESALRLADTTPPDRPETARAWQFSVEAAALEAEDRAGQWHAEQRLSLDGSWQGAVTGGTGWQWRFADRLDAFGPDRLAGDQKAVNTLKDLFVGGPVGSALTLDLGRINTRYGVAYGWNPTDYFRTDAVRAVSSPDPASLRENRLGTVMLRGQHLWSDGSFTAILAPQLAEQANADGASLDIGATNHSTRWLLGATQKLGADFAPQVLLYGDDEQPGSPRLGLNLTRLVGSACVAHLEASGGRVPSRLAVAQGRAGEDLDWRGQVVAGATCTSPWNQSLTLEVQHDGEALDAAGFRALAAGSPQDLAAYVRESVRGLNPLTRDQLFAQLRWTNAGIPQLDVSGYLSWSLADQSHSAWIEARYHWQRTDVALQWLVNSGGPATEHGLDPLHRAPQLLVRHWF